ESQGQDEIPDLSQQSPQNCPKCGNPVDGHYCQGCGLLRKKFKEDLFTSCVENGILQDSSEPSNDNTNVVNALREPFVVNQDHEWNSFTYDSTSNIVHDSPNIFDPPPQLPFYSYEFYGNDARYGHYCTPQAPFIHPEQCYNQDFNFSQDFHNFQQDLCCDNCGVTLEAYQSILPNEPDNSLSIGDEHLDTIPTMESNKFIKYSVENLVPNPSESEGPHHFNAKFDLIESLLNHDSSIISSSSKIDSLFNEFSGELTLLKSIPAGINETDCDPEEETHFIKRLLYDNSSPRPPKEFVSENSDAEIESFSPSSIPVEYSDSLMKEIDLSFTLDYPMSPGIGEDNYDFERDILILEELLSNDSLSHPENESFHFDIPSSSRPSAKPPDGNT
nr:hypothetical protein [Tanacetum cinerariifolium]